MPMEVFQKNFALKNIVLLDHILPGLGAGSAECGRGMEAEVRFSSFVIVPTGVGADITRHIIWEVLEAQSLPPSGVGGISSFRYVPDGGSTVMVLGVALSVIAAARRKFGA